MTLSAYQMLLLVAATAPLIGALGTLVTSLAGMHRAGRIMRGVTCIVAVLGGGVLAALLLMNEAESQEPVSLPAINWFAYSGLQTLRISFGLTTTWIQSLVVSICGVLTWTATSVIASRSSDPDRSNPAIVLISLLYGAGTLYLFAPNVSQALFAWLAVSYFAFLLYRLSTAGTRDTGLIPPSPTAARLVSGPTRWTPMHDRMDFVVGQWRNQVWIPVMKVLPEWIGEQLEVVEAETPSLQFVALTLGATAVLLTWLIAP